MDYIPTEGEKCAISLLEKEISNWKEGESYVNDSLVFYMTDIIKKARKNYFGVFKNDKDPTTGRKKLFIPLTEWMVKLVRGNIDIDTKDLEVDARRPSQILPAYFSEHFLKQKLEQADFGRKVNEMLDDVMIDGTAWMKVWKEKGELRMRVVDSLNMITDPSDDEEDSPKIERNILSIPEFREYSWNNMEFVDGDDSFDRTGIAGFESNIQSEIPHIDIYERYGWLPEFVRTNKEEDKNNFFYGHIIVSGIDSDKPVVHLVEEVKEHPYQKFVFKKVRNRSKGRGIPEMLFNIQAYTNETVNLRLNVSRIVQMGLWKIRGSITPQQLKRLFSTSAIKLDANSDIERLETGSIDAASYKDEEQANTWAQKVVGGTPVDEMSSNKPATNALIEERTAGKGYNQVLEELFLDLANMIKKKVAPILRDIFKDEDFVRICDDTKALEKMDDNLIRNIVNKESTNIFKESGHITLPEEIEMEVERLKMELNKQGTKRYAQLKRKMFDFDVDLRIDPSQEQVNKTLMANQINQAMQILGGAGVPPGLMKEPMKELFDLMGLDGERLTESLDNVDEIMNQKMMEEARINNMGSSEPMPQTEGAAMGAMQ